MDQPKMVQAEKPSQPAVTPTEASGRLATAKGEEPVDRIAECSGHFAALAGLPIQKAPAHLHEAGEDLWLEAQNDRNEKENGRETQ